MLTETCGGRHDTHQASVSPPVNGDDISTGLKAVGG